MYHDKLVSMPDNKIANKNEKKSDLDVYKETYPSVVYQDSVINDKIYGFPLSIDTLVLYYNPDIFNNVYQEYHKGHSEEELQNIRQIFNYGPKNWDEFVQAVRIITTRNGDQINRSAVALGTPDNVNQSVDILTAIMLQNGAKMTSDDFSTAQFATKQNVFSGADFPGTKALDFYSSFAKPGNDNYTWNASVSDALHAFAEGKTAMMIDYMGVKPEIKKINSKATFEMLPLPQIKETKNPVNYASYMTFTVTRASKNSSLAWDFITFAANQNNSGVYRSNTGKPAVRLSNISNSGQDTLMQALTAQSWYKPDPDKADQIFRDMIKQVNDGLNSQTAIENAASQITTLLEKLKQ